MIKKMFKKLILKYISYGCILTLFTGCSKTDIVDDKKEDVAICTNSNECQYTANFSKPYDDFDNGFFVLADIIDEKEVYLFYSMPDEFSSFHEETENYTPTFRLAYYEYNIEKGIYTLYKEIFTDETLNTIDIHAIDVYKNHQKLLVYADDDSSNECINIYNIPNKTNGYTCEFLRQINLNENSIDYLNLTDNNTLVYLSDDIIYIYNIKDGKFKTVNICDYCGKNIEFKDNYVIKNIEYNNEQLDIYYKVYDKVKTHKLMNIMYIDRIDITNQKLLTEKSYKCEFAKFVDDYIIFENNNNNFIINKKTLKKFDLKNFEADLIRISDKISQYDLNKTTIDIYIEENNIYLCGNNGIKIVNIENKKARKLACTDDMKINGFYKKDNIIYTTTSDAMYKIDINTDKKEKMTDLKGGLGDINPNSVPINVHNIYMLSDNEGYITCDYTTQESKDSCQDFVQYIWIKRK